MAVSMYILMRMKFQGMKFLNLRGASDEDCLRFIDGGKGNPGHADGVVFPQVIIGAYRVDFFIAYRTSKKLTGVVIECDGHEFHEKTKQQVRRDKARDRFLQSKDYKVLRFAGSELWEHPMLCADQALRDVYTDVGFDRLEQDDAAPVAVRETP